MEFDRSFKSIDWSFVRQDLFFVLLVIKIAFMRFPYLSRYKHWFFIWLVVQNKTSTVTTSLKKIKAYMSFLSLTLNWSSSTKYIILFKLVVRYIVLTHIVIFMLIFCRLLVKNLQIYRKQKRKKSINEYLSRSAYIITCTSSSSSEINEGIQNIIVDEL